MLTTTLAILATPVLALDAPRTGDFENNQLFIKGVHKNVEFTLEGNQAQGFTDFEVRGLIYTYQLSENVTSGVELFAKYIQPTDGFTAGGSYNLAYAVSPNSVVYGEAELSFGNINYETTDGQAAFIPKVGFVSDFNDTVAGFAEIKYGWNMTDDWSDIGGRAELGLDIAVNDTVMIVPSIVGYFDTEAWNDTQARLGVEFKF